uniref:Uncharacterized protein n=1 Tax=Wolfiporia cocos TaxID=81056 RepID=A0A7G7YDQ7_9APHY|nr:hypothetical protein [Wolfiporia cocos]QNH92627.1 hypothetical protein [Wolfiporia cocos]
MISRSAPLRNVTKAVTEFQGGLNKRSVRYLNNQFKTKIFFFAIAASQFNSKAFFSLSNILLKKATCSFLSLDNKGSGAQYNGSGVHHTTFVLLGLHRIDSLENIQKILRQTRNLLRSESHKLDYIRIWIDKPNSTKKRPLSVPTKEIPEDSICSCETVY